MREDAWMTQQIHKKKAYPATQQSNFEEQKRQNGVYYDKEESALNKSKFDEMSDL